MATMALRHLGEQQVADSHREGNSYRAADAIPLTPDSQHSPHYGRLVRGQEARVARRQAGEIRMPPDFSRGYTSIYELQTRPPRGSSGARTPALEPGSLEILVEAEDVGAPDRLHDREADRVGTGDRSRSQALEPAPRGGVVFAAREVNRHRS